jgi:hypothetical protein
VVVSPAPVRGPRRDLIEACAVVHPGRRVAEARRDGEFFTNVYDLQRRARPLTPGPAIELNGRRGRSSSARGNPVLVPAAVRVVSSWGATKLASTSSRCRPGRPRRLRCRDRIGHHGRPTAARQSTCAQRLGGPVGHAGSPSRRVRGHCSTIPSRRLSRASAKGREAGAFAATTTSRLPARRARASAIPATRGPWSR